MTAFQNKSKHKNKVEHLAPAPGAAHIRGCFVNS